MPCVPAGLMKHVGRANIEHRTSNTEHRTPNIEHRTSKFPFQTPRSPLSALRSKPGPGRRAMAPAPILVLGTLLVRTGPRGRREHSTFSTEHPSEGKFEVRSSKFQ